MNSGRADLRAGQTWTSLQKAKNDLVWAAAIALLFLARGLPRSWLRALGRGLGRIAYVVLARERRRALENLSRGFPRLTDAERVDLAARNFVQLGDNLGDTLSLLDPRELPETTLALPPESASALEEALAQKRGVIYVTAHLGPWERMAAVLAGRGFPITTMARESYDPRFDGLYERLRRPRGVHAIYRGHPSAPLRIVKALRNNRVVGFPVDLPGRVPTLPIQLLGMPSKLPVGPAKIALRTRAPIVVGTPAPRPDGGLEIRITPLRADDLEPGPFGEAALTQRMADALGERVRALPTHWPWLHPSFEDTDSRRRCDDAERADRLPSPP